MNIENKCREIWGSSKNEFVITESDKNFLNMCSGGIIMRQETGGLFHIYDDEQVELPAKMFTNLRWGYQTIERLKTFKVLPDSKVKILPWA